VKKKLQIIEYSLLLMLIPVVIAWFTRVNHKPTPMTYHFKGEFCGQTLWEYSASGNEVAIWADFFTNATFVHCVITTNTIDNWMKWQRERR